MKSFLKFSLLSLFVLSSCNSTNLSSSDNFNDLSFINLLVESDITTIITNLNENLNKINDDDLPSYAKVEENFLSLCLDIPLSYADDGNVINYMAFNVNRINYTNSTKTDNEKKITKELLANNNFRRALHYGIDKNKLVLNNSINNFTYALKDYVTSEFSYNKDKANELLLKAKEEVNFTKEIIHLDVVCLKSNEGFVNAFKENIENTFDKKIIIDTHLLSNVKYFKATEEQFDYDINLNVTWMKDNDSIDAFIAPLMNELLKYNGIGN